MKILSIVGARPQFIKAAAVSRRFLEESGIEEEVVHTGQHFDAGMSDIFFDELGIPKPSAHLDINGGSHGAMTGRMLDALDTLINERRPDTVLLYGDTNSTLAGALAAAKLHVPVAHVEAGLRSFNMRMPEEINRILTDQVSSFLFCPTRLAIRNLSNEGFDRRPVTIVLTGDVMLDAMQTFRASARAPQTEIPDGFVLTTIHRAENTDDPQRLAGIVAGLNRIHTDIAPVVLPLHPRTRAAIAQEGLILNVVTINPVGYLEMIWLLEQCSAVITDSGGLQKEAYFQGRACVTVRDETEWVELVDAGVNVLCPAAPEPMARYAEWARQTEFTPDLEQYGNGESSSTIIRVLAEAAY